MTTRTPGHRVLAYQVAKASPPSPNAADQPFEGAGTVIGVLVVGGAGKGFASTLGRGGRVICSNVGAGRESGLIIFIFCIFRKIGGYFSWSLGAKTMDLANSFLLSNHPVSSTR